MDGSKGIVGRGEANLGAVRGKVRDGIVFEVGSGEDFEVGARVGVGVGARVRAGEATFLRFSATTDGRERVLFARQCRLGGPAPSSSEFALRRTADDPATLSVCRSDSAGSGSTRRIAGTRLYRPGQLAADILRFERGRRCYRRSDRHHHLHRLLLVADAGEIIFSICFSSFSFAYLFVRDAIFRVFPPLCGEKEFSVKLTWKDNRDKIIGVKERLIFLLIILEEE